MKKLLALSLLFTAGAIHAQDKKSLDSVDNVIIGTIIQPAEDAAGSAGPDWAGVQTKIRASYTDVQTDRAVTKAKIYFYWNRDWVKFSSALVHYTDAYENKDDLALMNKNAKMILDYSQDTSDYKAALHWIQHAVDKAPDNSEYKATCDALKAKLADK